MKFLFIGVVVKSSNCRLIIVFSICIKKSGKKQKKTESKNKQEKVTAKYIPQKRQEKKLQNVLKQTKMEKKKGRNKQNKESSKVNIFKMCM